MYHKFNIEDYFTNILGLNSPIDPTQKVKSVPNCLSLLYYLESLMKESILKTDGRFLLPSEMYQLVGLTVFAE